MTNALPNELITHKRNVGIEPTTDRLIRFAVCILKLGADGETRTHKIWFLRPARIPIPSHRRKSGVPHRIRTCIPQLRRMVHFPVMLKGQKQQVSFNRENRTPKVCLEGKLSSIDMLWFAVTNLKLGAGREIRTLVSWLATTNNYQAILCTHKTFWWV